MHTCAREILGCDLGDSESEAFWQRFLASLRNRGLHGVRLVVTTRDVVPIGMGWG